MSYSVDMHCHPSMKTYLYDDVLDKKHPTSKEFDPRHMQVDLPKMVEGKIDVVLSAHHLPEIGLLKYCGLLKTVRFILDLFFKDLVDKVEKEGTAFKQTMSMVTQFEQKVRVADKKYKAIVARNPEEFAKAMDSGKRIFVHSIEGAHSLGRNLSLSRRISRISKPCRMLAYA